MCSSNKTKLKHNRKRTKRACKKLVMTFVLTIVQWLHLQFDYFVDYLFGFYYNGKRQAIAPAKSPLLQLSVVKLSKKLRDGEVTSEEIVQTYIDRINEVNGIINAVTDERFLAALDEARRVDKDIKSGAITDETFLKKPLLGIPFTTKESTLCKGMRATFGLISRKHTIAEEDADTVRRTKECGGILLAVTNVPQLNFWWESHNPVYGITCNPYDTTKMVGGSSGGESSLIASCASPWGIGTDIGGSIRIPSYMCGIFGHKLTNGLTPTKGMTFRDGSDTDTTMVATGPMVRYAEDLITCTKVLLGPDANKLKLDSPVDVTNLKYCYMLSIDDVVCSPVRPEVVKCVERAVKHFEEIATVEKIDLEGFRSSNKLFQYWITKEKSDFSRDICNRERRASAFPELFKYLTGKSEFSLCTMYNLVGRAVSPKVKEIWAEQITTQLKAELLDKLKDNGVLILPTMPMNAHHHHASYLRPYNYAYTGIFNVLKLPVTQVPLGLSEAGVPLGVQVVAGPYQDHLCIAVAKELEKAFGGYVPPF